MVFFLALGLLILSTSLYFASWISLTTAVCLNTLAVYLMFTPTHEASHRALARKVFVNDLFGRLALFFWVPVGTFPIYRWLHMQHHRFTNERGDPDLFAGGGRWSLPLRWLVIDVYQLIFYIRRSGRVRKDLPGFLLMWCITIAILIMANQFGFLRIGRQIIVWGRADELNPTDNVSSRDFTLLTPETGDQRLGTLAVMGAVHFDQYRLTGIWSPRIDSNVVPVPPAPGVTVEVRRPESGLKAVKLEQVGELVDWSVSYLKGLDLYPDIRIGSMGTDRVRLVLENNEVQVIGADVAAAIGSYGVRAEVAYTRPSDSSRVNPLAKHPFLYTVVGADKTFPGNVNVNFQYYFRRVFDYRNPRVVTDPVLREMLTSAAISANQLDRFQHGLSFRVAGTWIHETLHGELAGVYSLTHRDYVLRPKFIYAVNDQLKVSLGAEMFRGRRDTYFGRLREVSSVYAELKYSF